MGEPDLEFNITSLRDKLNNLNNMAAKAAKTPIRVSKLDDFSSPEIRSAGLVSDNKACGSDVGDDIMGIKDDVGVLASDKMQDSISDLKKKSPPVSYASAVNSTATTRKVNFRTLSVDSTVDGVDLLIPITSVLEVNNRFSNSLYGYFLGDRLAFPVVENYVKNSWAKFGLKKVMMNNAGFFFFQFESKTGMEQVLEKGPWMIRSTPIFLNEWSPNVCLTKQELSSVPVWVKLYDVPLVAYTEDGLSMLATKLGKPIMLDSYSSHMCLNSWGRHSFARALIELDASCKLKNELIVGIPKVDGDGFTKETVSIEYEWRPPHCEHCKVFGHNNSSCSAKMKNVEHAGKQVQDEVSVGKQVQDDGFIQVTRRRGKGHQVEGIKLSKPKPHLVYKPKQSNSSQPKGSTPGNSAQDANKKQVTSNGGNKDGASTSSSKPIDTNNFTIHNIFSVLGDGVDEFGIDTGEFNKGSQKEGCTTTTVAQDSDDDEVEVIYEESSNKG